LQSSRKKFLRQPASKEKKKCPALTLCLAESGSQRFNTEKQLRHPLHAAPFLHGSRGIRQSGSIEEHLHFASMPNGTGPSPEACTRSAKFLAWTTPGRLAFLIHAHATFYPFRYVSLTLLVLRSSYAVCVSESDQTFQTKELHPLVETKASIFMKILSKGPLSTKRMSGWNESSAKPYKSPQLGSSGNQYFPCHSGVVTANWEPYSYMTNSILFTSKQKSIRSSRASLGNLSHLTRWF
jgi:hypothetical protein